MKKRWFFIFLDTVRIGLVCITFYVGYSIGYKNGTYDPVAQLHFMIPWVIFAIAGISGLEALIWPDETADAKGYETGSNYQRQSAIALLSYAVVAVLIACFKWGLYAELTIFFAFIFFFFFSAINHALDAIRRHNYAWQNINRPFITALLIAGMLYPVIQALQQN